MSLSCLNRVLLVWVGVGLVSGLNAADRLTTGVPRYDEAVQRAVAWLKDGKNAAQEKEKTLVAYALYKAGEDASSPLVAAGIADALERAESGYVGYDHVYLAGVDAMLLADIDPKKYQSAIQRMVNHVQSTQRADGSWSDTPTSPADSSMAQYSLLCLWAGDRAECTISPNVLEQAAAWHMNFGQSDGGWAYRPGITNGPEMGLSQSTTTMAGAGSLAIIRLLLHGQRVQETKKKDSEKRYGYLEEADPVAEEGQSGGKFPGFKSRYSAAALDARIDRGFNWVSSRFSPTADDARAKNYFYYALERAAALHGMDDISGRDWFTVYADGLLTYQAADGSFDKTYLGPRVDTAFAILYLMRSTQRIIDKMYGIGLTQGKKGNPFGDKVDKREPTELDQLLAAMEKLDVNDPKFDNADEQIANEVVRSVQAIDDPEALVGQKDRLKALLEHPNADIRRSVYWALGRTGDFALIPLMLQGLRDPNIDVNVEAEMALRYIARRPAGFGFSSNPKAGAEKASEEEQLKVVNEWRFKAYTTWGKWYSEIRPFEEKDGLDDLQVKVAK